MQADMQIHLFIAHSQETPKLKQYVFRFLFQVLLC